MVNFDELKAAMGELEEDEVVSMLNSVMADGGSQAQEAMDACQEGMNQIGKYFEEGEYFIGDLIFAGELMTQAVEILKPALIGSEEGKKGGKVLLCTVEGDLHDIGKNIVRAMLEAGGIEVVDLGIDVKPQQIIDTVKAEDIHVVVLSGVLTLAVDSMVNTIAQLQEHGLRNEVKVLIGGAPVNEKVMELAGADDWAFSPQKTVQRSQEWIQMYA